MYDSVLNPLNHYPKFLLGKLVWLLYEWNSIIYKLLGSSSFGISCCFFSQFFSLDRYFIPYVTWLGVRNQYFLRFVILWWLGTVGNLLISSFLKYGDKILIRSKTVTKSKSLIKAKWNQCSIPIPNFSVAWKQFTFLFLWHDSPKSVFFLA